jgi:radial spoke head protein 4A
LVKEKNLQSARFWGKINGLSKPYYIVESEAAAPDEEAEKLDPEAKQDKGEDRAVNLPEFEGFPGPKKIVEPNVPKEEASGCNKYTYFVCNASTSRNYSYNI